MRLARLDHDHLANRALVHQLLRLHDRRGEDLGLEVAVAHPVAAGGLQHRPGLGGVPPEGLGAEQVAPRLGQSHAGVTVQEVREADDVEVDVLARDQLVEAIRGVRDPPLLGEGLGPLAGPREHADDPLVRHVGERLHVEVGHEAGADQREPHLVLASRHP